MAEQDEKQQALNLELRQDIGNAYASVKGSELSKSFASITYEELLDQQIERISGQSFDQRPNEMERIDKTEQRLLAAIEKVRALPPEVFRRPDPNKDVNT